LSLKKCSLAQKEVNFVGYIIGSGRHRPDEEKLATISELARPKIKEDARRMLGFFNYFHSYVPQLANLCVLLTNLLAKDKPNEFVWTDVEEQAFENLKSALCDCVRANLFTALVIVQALLSEVASCGMMKVEKNLLHSPVRNCLVLNLHGQLSRKKLMLSYGR